MIKHHSRHCSLFDSPSAKSEKSCLSEEHDLSTTKFYSVSPSKTIQSYGIGGTEENAKYMRPFQTIPTKEDLQHRRELFENQRPLTDRECLIICNIRRRNISLALVVPLFEYWRSLPQRSEQEVILLNVLSLPNTDLSSILQRTFVLGKAEKRRRVRF